MIDVWCPNCQKKVTVAQDRRLKKKMTATCRKCGSELGIERGSNGTIKAHLLKVAARV